MLYKITRYFFLPIYRPEEGILSLSSEKNKVLYAVLIFLFLGIIYTISVQIAYTKGLGASVNPFIKIPAEDYYYWQRFYQIPFFFTTSIVFAGIVRLLSVPLKGEGSFEDHFCLFAVAQTFPMFITMWIPETIYFVFHEQTSVVPLWVDIVRQIIGILWALIIMVAGVSIIEKMKWYVSMFIVLLSAIPVIGLMVIFIR